MHLTLSFNVIILPVKIILLLINYLYYSINLLNYSETWDRNGLLNINIVLHINKVRVIEYMNI